MALGELSESLLSESFRRAFFQRAFGELAFGEPDFREVLESLLSEVIQEMPESTAKTTHFYAIVKNYVFVAKICKYAPFERTDSFCCTV